MEIDRKELKRLARERMKLTRPKFWQVALVYLLLVSTLPAAVDCIPFPNDAGGLGTASLFLSILITMFTTVVSFGYNLWSLWTFRQMDPGMYSLLQGFSVAGRVILLELAILTRTVGWTMLFSFAITVPATLALGAMPFLFPLLVAFLTAVIWLIRLRYALAHYLLADRPDDGPLLAIRRSVELMRQWKWELFKLEFSFLGWELLSLLPAIALVVVCLFSGGLFQALTAGDMETVSLVVDQVFSAPVVTLFSSLSSLPLLLWLQPYRGVTRAGFYDARLRLHRAEHAETPPV